MNALVLRLRFDYHRFYKKLVVIPPFYNMGVHKIQKFKKMFYKNIQDLALFKQLFKFKQYIYLNSCT